MCQDQDSKKHLFNKIFLCELNDHNLYPNFTAEYFLRKEKPSDPIHTVGSLCWYCIYSPPGKWLQTTEEIIIFASLYWGCHQKTKWWYVLIYIPTWVAHGQLGSDPTNKMNHPLSFASFDSDNSNIICVVIRRSWWFLVFWISQM